MSNVTLDDLDRAIITALQRDGRMSVPALADHVGTSRATAYARFNRLLDAGVITGFRAEVDPVAVGNGVAALVLISAHQTSWSMMADQLRTIHGAEWVGVCAGQHDFAMIVRAADLTELRDVVLDGLLRQPDITNVQTSVLLDEL